MGVPLLILIFAGAQHWRGLIAVVIALIAGAFFAGATILGLGPVGIFCSLPIGLAITAITLRWTRFRMTKPVRRGYGKQYVRGHRRSIPSGGNTAVQPYFRAYPYEKAGGFNALTWLFVIMAAVAMMIILILAGMQTPV